MRLTVIMMLATSLHLSAKGLAQEQKVTMDESQIRLDRFLKILEEKTLYHFTYSLERIPVDKKLTIKARKEPLFQLLERILKQQGLGFRLVGEKLIVITGLDVNGPVIEKAPGGALREAPKDTIIKGNVIDKEGKPIEGVSVVVKGRVGGTTTNGKGEFLFVNIPLNSTLLLTYVGYASQEVAVGSRTSLTITMQDSASSLGDVVVVGYGTQKKVSVTGAVSSIKSAELTVTKNENVVNMLAGKLSGVRVVQSTGEPGDYASTIQIRGFGTPLVIIDGVPRDNLAQLDPNTIESISVLKDASASIYGVRAANGVILVTTKKGSQAKTDIQYSGFYGVQTPIRQPRGLSTDKYMEIVNENNIMRGSVPAGTLLYSLQEIEDYRSGKKQGTDWSRINSDYYAPQYQNNIAVTGGSRDINYFIGFGNLKQEGIYSTGDLNYKRYSIRSNISGRISKDLKAELLINGMTGTKNSPYGSDNRQQYFRTVWVLKPTLPAYANYNRDYPQEVLQGYNPLVMTSSDIIGYQQDNEKIFQSTGNLTWDIPYIKGLQAKASYSYDYSFWESKALQKPYTLYQYDLSSDTYIPAQHGNTVLPGTSSLTRSTRFSQNTLLQASLNYSNTFASRHHVGGLLLYEEGTTNMDNFYASRYIDMTSIEELLGGITLDQQGGMDGSGFNSALNPTDQSGLWQIANKALVGRVNYDLDSKYFADFSFRYDGSSKFASGHQWGFFPSVSAGWRISQEPFFRDNRSLTFINNLKLRGSFGVSGDDRTATFQYVPGYTYPVSAFVWPVRMFGDAMAAGIALKATPNPNLTWMTARHYDIGLDADLWNGLFSFELDAFRRNRSGLVGTRVSTIPDWLGQSLAQENLNKDATIGFDLSLRHRNTINTSLGKIEYGIAANVSVTRTKTVYIERLPPVDQYDNWRNNPNNRWNDLWWGVNSTGQFQNYDAIFSGPIIDGQGNSQLKPGDYSYQDWNGDGVIDAWDQHPIATGANSQNTPRVYYGFTVDLKFKGFDLTAVFQGGALSTVKYDGVLAYAFSYDGNGPDFYYDRWHMQDPTADPKDPRTVWIPGTYPTTSQSSAAMGLNYGTNSTATIHRADYLRCKSLELGYTVPGKILDKVGIRNLRIFGTAYNILTITKLKYLDPEHPSANNGFDYPLTRTINVGGTINF